MPVSPRPTQIMPTRCDSIGDGGVGKDNAGELGDTWVGEPKCVGAMEGDDEGEDVMVEAWRGTEQELFGDEDGPSDEEVDFSRV